MAGARPNMNLVQARLECVGSFLHFVKLFDRDDEASVRDHINHSKDTRKQTGVGKVNDSTFQLVRRVQCSRQIISNWKDIGDLEADGVSCVYQWPLLAGGGSVACASRHNRVHERAQSALVDEKGTAVCVNRREKAAKIGQIECGEKS